MNSRTRNRTDRCQLRSTPTRPCADHGPFLSPDDTMDETSALDVQWSSDSLDAMLDEDWSPEDLEDFLERFD